MNRGRPLRRQSPKRRAERAAREQVLADVAARDGYWCCAMDVVPEVACWAPGGRLDGDEIVKRSAMPGGHLDPANVQLICRAHHDWREANPIEAAHRGLRPYPIGYMGERRSTRFGPHSDDTGTPGPIAPSDGPS